MKSNSPKAVAVIEQRAMKKNGFYIHYINGGMTEECINVRTFGLKKSFKHPEIQIVLPIKPELANELLNNIGREIKAGKIYAEGMTYKEILEGYPVTFIRRKTQGTDVLRLVLPDPTGNISENAEFPYCRQHIAEDLPK